MSVTLVPLKVPAARSLTFHDSRGRSIVFTGTGGNLTTANQQQVPDADMRRIIRANARGIVYVL